MTEITRCLYIIFSAGVNLALVNLVTMCVPHSRDSVFIMWIFWQRLWSSLILRNTFLFKNIKNKLYQVFWVKYVYAVTTKMVLNKKNRETKIRVFQLFLIHECLLWLIDIWNRLKLITIINERYFIRIFSSREICSDPTKV